MTKTAVINAYNEMGNINRALNIHNYVDKVKVYDGAYKEYPHKYPYSTDGMVEYLESRIGIDVIKATEAYENQNVKRTKMFEDKETDYFIRIDADEWVANPDELNKLPWGDFDVAWAWMHSNLYAQPYMKPVIFRNIPGMHYAGRHHWLFDGQNKLISSDQNMTNRYKHIDTKLRFYNFRNVRTEKRLEDKKTLVHSRPWEQKYKNENEVYKTVTPLIPHHARAGKPRNPSVIYKHSDSLPVYTFTVMVTRLWALDRYFTMLEKQILPVNTEFVAVLDTDNELLVRKFHAGLKRVADKFTSIRYYVTGNPKLAENAKVSMRRQRIADNWNIILTESRGDFLLTSEDDSLPIDNNAYARLLDIFHGGGGDLIQGNIISRWNVNLCPAWQVEEDENGNPVKVYTLEEQKEGLSQIHGCGWYCFVTLTDTFRSQPMYVDNLLPLGPDVRHGYLLHRSGYTLAHAWDIHVEHFGEDWSLKPGIDKTITKCWIKEGNVWKTL